MFWGKQKNPDKKNQRCINGKEYLVSIDYGENEPLSIRKKEIHRDVSDFTISGELCVGDSNENLFAPPRSRKNTDDSIFSFINESEDDNGRVHEEVFDFVKLNVSRTGGVLTIEYPKIETPSTKSLELSSSCSSIVSSSSLDSLSTLDTLAEDDDEIESDETQIEAIDFPLTDTNIHRTRRDSIAQPIEETIVAWQLAFPKKEKHKTRNVQNTKNKAPLTEVQAQPIMVTNEKFEGNKIEEKGKKNKKQSPYRDTKVKVQKLPIL